MSRLGGACLASDWLTVTWLEALSAPTFLMKIPGLIPGHITSGSAEDLQKFVGIPSLQGFVNRNCNAVFDLSAIKRICYRNKTSKPYLNQQSCLRPDPDMPDVQYPAILIISSALPTLPIQK